MFLWLIKHNSRHSSPLVFMGAKIVEIRKNGKGAICSRVRFLFPEPGHWPMSK